MLHPLRGGAHASRRTQNQITKQSQFVLSFQQRLKMPNSVGARLRQHPRFAVFYALRNGYDVKAVMKIAFIGFTFEAKDKRVRKPTKSGAPEA
jgi:hypothetical protein